MKTNQDGVMQLQLLKKTWSQDLRAGIVIFLIALPLSIGIALASGAPAMAGVWSAVVGGILGSFFTGGHVMINGPAAGLIVVVLTSVQQIGWQQTCAAIFIAGILQMVMSWAKAARLANCVPVNVLHGMLASIGIIIIVKQSFVFMGIEPETSRIFQQLGEIPLRFMESHTKVILVGVVSLLAMLGMQVFGKKFSKIVPPPLVAVLLGVATSIAVGLDAFPKFLLNVPLSPLESLALPDFSGLAHPLFWKMVVTIALVSSIESLLSSLAVDRLDSQERRSNLDRDLLAKGFLNAILGLIGGLPIITEIVRSSANINNGAKTRWSNFVHGLLILLFVFSLPQVLNQIPLATFAAILMLVGFQLSHPKTFKHAFEIGWDQLAVFVFTLVAVLLTDILVGVIAGLVFKVLINAVRAKTFLGMFFPRFVLEQRNSKLRIAWKTPASFLSVLPLAKILQQAELNDIELNLSEASFVDHTFIDFIDFQKNEMKSRGVNLSIVFSDKHHPTAEHHLSSRALIGEGLEDRYVS